MVQRLQALLIAALLAGFGASATAPSYYPTPFPLQVEYADCIVAGEITSLSDTTYELTVERWARKPESAPERVLTVKRFHNWLCASRWTEYAVGQRVFLFATWDEEEELAEVMSAGNEGEHLLVENDLILRGESLRGLPYGEVELVTVRGVGSEAYTTPRRFRGTRVAMSAFTDAVVGLDEAVEWVPGGETTSREKAVLRRGREAYLQFARSSPEANALAHLVARSEQWRWFKPVDPGPVLDLGANGLRFGTQSDQTFMYTNAGVATALGDLNQDGYPEVVFTQHARESETPEVFVRYGTGDDGPGHVEPLSLRESGAIRDGGKRVKPSYNAPMVTLAPLGDLDGNGFPDLLVGNGYASELAILSGSLAVVFLGEGGSVVQHRELVSSPEVRALFESEQVDPKYAQLGVAMCVLGDIDADGTVEVLVLASQSPDRSFEPTEPTLSVLLSLGPDGAVVAARRFDESLPKYARPHRWPILTSLGDLDGNGASDIARSIDLPEGSGILIEHLASNGSVEDSFVLSSQHPLLVDELGLRERIHPAIASPGDLTGDGNPDLVLMTTQSIWRIALSAGGRPIASKRLCATPKLSGEDAFRSFLGNNTRHWLLSPTQQGPETTGTSPRPVTFLDVGAGVLVDIPKEILQRH